MSKTIAMETEDILFCISDCCLQELGKSLDTFFIQNPLWID